MSSFMKDVVSEVLKRNRTVPPAPVGPAASAVACTAGSKDNCPHTCSAPGNCPKPGLTLPLKRTNYQKEQAVKRLASIAAEAAAAIGIVQQQAPGGAAMARAAGAERPLPASGSILAAAAQAGKPAPPVHTPVDAPPVPGQQFAEHYLSPLLQRTLSWPEQKDSGLHGGPPARPSVPPEAQDPLEPLRLPAADMEVWLFPRISDELRPLLGSPGRNYSAAGVISAPNCHPGQLFAAEELLPQDSGLEADISWSTDGGGFELKLFGSDHRVIADKLKQLTARMQDGSGTAVRVWISREPGRLLRRYFGGGPQEAVAVVAGSSRWNSIGIAEQWLQRNPGSGLRLSAERSYCILTGTTGQMAAAAPGLAGLSAPHR